MSDPQRKPATSIVLTIIVVAIVGGVLVLKYFHSSGLN